MSRNIKIAAIVFIIILIPIGLVLKRLIAIEYQKNALELFYLNPGDVKLNKELALKRIDIAIRLTPRNYLFYSTKSQMLWDLDQNSQAVKYLKKSIKLDPTFAEGILGLGMIYDYLRYSDSATIQYENAIDIYDTRLGESDPESYDFANAEVNKLYVKLLLQDTAFATKELKRLILKYPNDPTLQSLINFEKDSFIKELYDR